ncbi:hypothetical protein N431DRAFT_446948 [Stipitochalara longipes BDJ]|nr:hypothetical protein N431DRAFT_446948 [Stipitochalara longipes BDJ]
MDAELELLIGGPVQLNENETDAKELDNCVVGAEDAELELLEASPVTLNRDEDNDEIWTDEPLDEPDVELDAAAEKFKLELIAVVVITELGVVESTIDERLDVATFLEDNNELEVAIISQKDEVTIVGVLEAIELGSLELEL